MKKANYILGLNAYGLNTSASLLKNGLIIGAVEEERLNREKRTRKFPIKSILYLLDIEKIKISDLSAIAVSWNPLINLEKFEKHKSEHLSYIPDMLHAIPNQIIKILSKQNLDMIKQEIYLTLNKKIPIYYINHHVSHASNYFFSNFNNASILTVDAFGEKQCTGFYKGRSNKVTELWKQEFPHSLGSFYSTFTEFCGFKPQSDEWKLMGASSYGDYNKYYKLIRGLVDLNEGKGIELDLKYFNHYLFHRPHYHNKALSDYLKIKPNKENSLSKNYYDICAAAQKVFEDIYFHFLNSLWKLNKNKNLVLSGGCALNSLANGKIIEKTKFENIFIPPVPDDSGAGLGAAYHVYNSLFKYKKKFVLTKNYLGPEYSKNKIEIILNKYSIKYKFIKYPWIKAAKSISEGKIIGWFQGRLEFGDRALGNRSILADPRKKNMKDRINKCVKYREKFRPFAPAVLEEQTNNYFQKYQESIFMEKTIKIRKEKQSIIPAVTHYDGTGRLQTVKKNNNLNFYLLIKEFERLTGVPVVLNTSFNYKGDPIVCSPEDAIKTFYLSGLDEMFIGNFWINK